MRAAVGAAVAHPGWLVEPENKVVPNDDAVSVVEHSGLAHQLAVDEGFGLVERYDGNDTIIIMLHQRVLLLDFEPEWRPQMRKQEG